MAYGSAPSMEDRDIRAYLEHIFRFYRNASATDEHVRDLRRRYEAAGGSRLYDVSRRIVAGVQQRLDQAMPRAFRVHLAMKHSPPFIEDVTREIASSGCTSAVGLALAPFPGRFSTDGYYKLVRDVGAQLDAPIDWRFGGEWHLHPTFLELWRRRIAQAIGGLGDEPFVVFTNHSLPARIREWADPYERAFADTAAAIAERSGLARWSHAFQSEGGGGVPWLGPSLDAVLREQVAAGHRAFLVAPIGFLMDHLEVLYDVDVVVRRLADELGITLRRPPMPNDDPLLLDVLADVVRRTAEPVGEAQARRATHEGSRAEARARPSTPS